MIQQLAAHLPTYYSNKWRESTKKMEASCGEYSFENFVEFLHEARLDTNHSVFSRDPLNSTRRELEKEGVGKERSSPAEKAKWNPNRRDKERWHGHSTTFSTIANEFPLKAPMDMSLCTSCKGRHSLSPCKAFLEKPFKERHDLCMTRGVCFSCLNPGQMYCSVMQYFEYVLFVKFSALP